MAGASPASSSLRASASASSACSRRVDLGPPARRSNGQLDPHRERVGEPDGVGVGGDARQLFHDDKRAAQNGDIVFADEHPRRGNPLSASAFLQRELAMPSCGIAWLREQPEHQRPGELRHARLQLKSEDPILEASGETGGGGQVAQVRLLQFGLQISKQPRFDETIGEITRWMRCHQSVRRPLSTTAARAPSIIESNSWANLAPSRPAPELVASLPMDK